MPPYDFLRIQNIYDPNKYPIGNDMPQQGGIMGNQQPPFQVPQFPPPMPSGLQVPESVTVPPQSESLDINEIFNKMYTPQTQATEAFQSHIDAIPERNKPGKWRKFASVVAGMGEDGTKAQQEVLYGPYQRAMEDQQAKYKPLESAANLERYGNVNERTLAHNTATSTVSAERARIASDAENRRRTSEENQTKISRAKLQLDQFKAEHPDWITKDNMEDGYIYLVNPQDPSATPINTGLTHGELSDLDKQRFALRLKQTATPRAPGADIVSATDWSTGVPVLGTLDRATNIFTPAQTTEGMPAQGRPQPPSQQNAALLARANRLVSESPELARYIQIDENGVRVIGNPPPAVNDAIKAQLYDEQIPGNIGLNPANTPPRLGGPGPRGGGPTPPPGVPPNAKPRTLRNGTVVYEVP